jgi:SOS-response transcriptional repressor LexA
LPELLRGWFGPDAGLPGTAFQVSFVYRDQQWHVAPLHVEQTGPPVDAPAAAPAARQPTAVQQNVSAESSVLETSQWPAGFRTRVAAARRYRDCLPVHDLSASAGFWSNEQQPEAQGWVPVSGVTLQPGMFIGRVSGRSMEPRIADGSWCIFRPCPAGSREGRLLLVQLRTAESADHGGRFTIKRYHSEREQTPDGWQHKSIQLQALNPDYPTINLNPEDTSDLRILAEFVRVL